MNSHHIYALALLLSLSWPALAAKQADTSAVSNNADTAPLVLTDAQPEAYRQLLLQIIDNIDQVSLLTGREETRWTLQRIRTRIDVLEPEHLARLIQQAPPLAQLQERLQQSQNLLATTVLRHSDGNDIRGIDFPEPETTVAACSSVESTFAFVLFAEWGVIKEILAALRWVCLDEVAGLNSAEDCTVENVLVNAAELEYLAADACLKEQRDAYLEAILETDENIANYLSDFVDATTSSRASQDTLDDIQSDVSDSLSSLDTLESSLDDDLDSIESDLNEVQDDLDNLGSELNTLTAVADDIQFRVQENQVDIEDAQTRAADAQATAEEIRSDTQTIISDLSDLQSAVDSLDSDVSGALTQATKAALVAALADPRVRVIRFMLPESVGGELEGSREIVVQTLLAFDQVGAKTTTARDLLSQGDLAYNQQNYLVAYQFFAQAYQALLGAAPSQPGIFR
ncbi:MAG: hypothetical protein Tsb002_26600 [Wenzhouxiangellaceae bacterium]